MKGLSKNCIVIDTQDKEQMSLLAVKLNKNNEPEIDKDLIIQNEVVAKIEKHILERAAAKKCPKSDMSQF